MSTFEHVRETLTSALGLGERGQTLTMASGLFGEMPEFDSMAVVNVVTALEDRFDIYFEDEEIDGEVFETVGTLVAFVDRKLAA